MKAVVLAAGRGARLGALTEAAPKVMLRIAGRPLVDHALAVLAKTGVREVFMNLYHQPDAVRGYCGDGARWGVRVSYAVEPELLGTAGALLNFRQHLTDAPFLVAYGDNYFECDLSPLVEQHARHGGVATLGLFERDDVSGCGVVQLDGDGRVVGFVEKPPPSAAVGRLINGAAYMLSPEIFGLLPAVRPCDFGYHVFPELIRRGAAVYGCVLDGAVWGCDTPELYRTLSEHLGHGAH